MTSNSTSQQQIYRWQQQFLELNRSRLSSARSLMTSRQLLVLDVLPLLLHINHQQLPGFVSRDTPFGIIHYQANTEQVQAMQAIARGVQAPRGLSNRDILGVYLMGSLGSLAQSRSSDFDVWLCHNESLDDQQLALLKQKCQLIEVWAASQNVELHFFLMNLSDFRRGQSQSAEGEDCGSSQHLLLLDEFYRSALWLAGAQPSWWLIPSHLEHDTDAYWQSLVHEHKVHADHWLHFGSIASIPAAEFVGAGLWQLNKGLISPYKALLKLLLTRHYASQYPDIRPLCWDLKALVHNGKNDVESCDAYRLMLERVIGQLEQEDNQQRIQLARRAFYYKARLPLSELSGSQHDSWRAQGLHALCRQWGWHSGDFIELDQRADWSPVRVSKERNALISEMLSSYRFLAGFSQKYAPKLHIRPTDMRLLGNRLYAAFDARPGKIMDINPGISPSLEQDKLTMNRKKSGVWQLIPGNWDRDDNENNQVLKQSPSLVELLYFSQFNGLLNGHTHIALYPQHNPLSQYELKEILQIVRSEEIIGAENQQLMHPPQPLRWRLLINVGVDPQHNLSRRGMQKISNRDDALGYSAIRENLINTLDLLTINSWGEWQVERFEGADCMLMLLQYLLQSLPQAQHQGWPEISCHCHCASRASTIRLRTEELISDVLQHFQLHPRSPYLIEAAEKYYLLESDRNQIQLHTADSAVKLLPLLQRPKENFSPYVLDKSALIDSPLKLIFERARSGIWQLFYWRKDDKIFVYLLDDKGALLHQQWHDKDGARQLIPVIRFLRQLDQRWLAHPGRKPARTQQRKILLFELRHKKQSFELELQRRKLPDLTEQTSSLDISAVVDEQQQTTLYCNSQEFSVWQFGDQLYQAVAEEIHAISGQHDHFRCNLSGLTLPGNNQQIIEHLLCKQRIEKQLNQALQQAPSQQ